MNVNRRRDIILLLSRILQFLPSYCIIIFVLYSALNDEKYIYLSILLVIVPIAIYFINKYILNAGLFLLSHIAIFIINYFMSINNYQRIVNSIYLGILIIISLVNRNDKKEQELSNASIGYILIIFVMQLVASAKNLTILVNTYMILVLLYAFLYLLNMYFINFKKFVEGTNAEKNLSIHDLKSGNRILLIIFIGISILITIFVPRLNISQVLSALKNFFGKLINFVLELMGPNNPEVIQKAEKQITESGTVDANPFWEFIAHLIWFFIAAALIISILYIAYNFITNLKGTKAKEYTTYEYISPFTKKEKIPYTKKKNHYKIPIWGITNSQKIRKLYYSLISKNLMASKKELTKLTPEELMSELNLTLSADQTKEITAFYEKARYHQEQCTKDDVQKVKALISKC